VRAVKRTLRRYAIVKRPRPPAEKKPNAVHLI
jgi:hypothetical protein